MSDISNALMFTEGGATKIIGRLEKRGLVTRKRSDADKRAILINLTTEGADKLSAAVQATTKVAHPLLNEAYSEQECAAMVGLLEKLDRVLSP